MSLGLASYAATIAVSMFCSTSKYCSSIFTIPPRTHMPVGGDRIALDSTRSAGTMCRVARAPSSDLRGRGESGRSIELPDRLAVRPGQPRGGGGLESVEMPLEHRQILEGLDTIELTGMDDRHEEVAHLSALRRLVEEGRLPVQDGAFQGPLHDV